MTKQQTIARYFEPDVLYNLHSMTVWRVGSEVFLWGIENGWFVGLAGEYILNTQKSEQWKKKNTSN